MRILPLTKTLAAALASALVLGLAACGGGGDALDEGSAQATDADSAGQSNENVFAPAPGDEREQALAVGSGPAVGTLVLASSNAAGRARGGSLCGVSANGSLVAFGSSSSAIVAGDTNNAADVFVKNVRTGAVTRVSTTGSGAQMPAPGASCVAITPDGRSVLLSTAAGLVVKNVLSGAVTQVSPPVNSVPQNTGFTGGAISDDGDKVVFQTVPSQSYAGPYLFVNNVPSRLMVRDLSNGSLTTLQTDNGIVAQGEVVIGGMAISPDGNKVAFVSSSGSLVAGDTNGQYDVFVRDLATGATSLASSNSSGVPAVLSFCCNQFYSGLRFNSNDRVLFRPSSPSSLGETGHYVKNLATGGLTLLLAEVEGSSPSLSADGNKLAFDRQYSGFDRRAFVRVLSTGQETLVSATAAGVASNGNAGVPIISRDGSSVAFHANSTNLVSPAPPANSYQVYLKTIGAAAATSR